MSKFSIDSVFISKIIQGAQAQGLDCRPLMLKYGISALNQNNVNSRVPLDAFAALALEIMRTLDDEFLGLALKATTTRQLQYDVSERDQCKNVITVI